MRRHVNSPQFKALIRRKGQAVMACMHALYDPRELQLDYDATYTGTAAETYAARKGNCLSLVIMTAAFARELGMTVRFQERASRGNLEPRGRPVPGQLACQPQPGTDGAERIDDSVGHADGRFRKLPTERQRAACAISTKMTSWRCYMNNRAAEELVHGRASRGLLVGARRAAEKAGADGRPTIRWP